MWSHHIYFWRLGVDTLLMSFIVVPGSTEVGEQWMDREGPDRPGLRCCTALHNSVGTFHIIADVNGIVQCTA